MHVKLQDAKADLSRLVERALAGEEIIIAEDGQPLVRLVAVRPSHARRTLDGAAGEIRIADDFDAPLPDFAAYR